MNILFMDGGELGTNKLWDFRGKNITAGAVSIGLTGNYYYSGYGKLGKVITARTSLYLSCRFIASVDDTRYFFDLYGNNGSTLLCGFYHSGLFARFANITTEWIGNLPLVSGTAYRVEMYWLMNTWTPPTPYGAGTPNNDGAVTIKINGVICLQQTNIRTTNYNYACDYLSCGSNLSGTDDYIVVADEWPGNLRIQALWPDTDDVTSWDCSTGSDHANLVDEAVTVGEVFTAVDAEYNYTNVVDEEETYTMSDLTEDTNPIDTIAAVQVSVRCKQEGTATPQQIQVIARHGTTSGYSSSLSVEQDAYAYRSAVFGDNPATSAEWTPAEVNAMKAGMRSKT